MMRLVRARPHHRLLLSGVLLLASFGAVATVLGTGIAGSSSAGSFPPAGTDAMGASSSVGVQMPCGTGATDTLQLNGTLSVERSNPTPGPNGDQITTQLESMQLTGLDPTLGQVQITLNPSMSSTGAVIADGTEADFPAHSFFDVFTEISVNGEATGLSNPTASPAVMSTDGITTIPPIGSVFSLQGGPVPLQNTAGAEQGCIVSAQLTLTSQLAGPVVGTLNAGPSSIDHFACYGATNLAASASSVFNIPPIVQLNNQFGGFYGLVGPLAFHCNPTQKTLPPIGGVSTPPTPITNPNAHLACFVLKVPSPQSPMTVQMTNQFGTGTLTTGKPILLCLPSWKNLAATSVPALSEPPGLDHYVCYSVSHKVMPAPPAGIVLQDQFNNMQSPPSQTTVTLGPPNLACLPSLKTINAATAVPVPSKLIHPEAHMVCYPIAAVANQASPPGGTVTDFNQWGVGVVTIGTLHELCVPSLKSQRVPTNTIVVSKTVQDPLTGGAGLAGVVFQAVPSNPTNPSGSCTTGPSGTCSITGLGIDTYTVSEVSAPPPYNVTLAPPQTTVFTSAPQTNVLGFSDPPPQGSNTIDITKVTNPNSAGGGTPLGGATFTAVPTVNPANPTGSCTTTLPTGTCQITGLGVDTYLVSETVPPTGYAPVAPQTVTFTTSPQTQTLTIFDNPITTQVSNTVVITKKGLRGVKLAGAVFTAVPSNPINPVGACTSTATGTCTIAGLGIDTYTIVETKAPAGYNPAPNSTITFTLAPQTLAVTITDPVIGASG